MDPADLLARAAAGEESAWREVVSRYQALVHSIVRAHRIAPSDGEDLFQEVFLRLHRHALRIEDPRALARWVAVTTRNLCLDHLSRAKRERATSEADEARDPTPAVDLVIERVQRTQEVREALATLPESCQELLRLLYYEMDEPDYRRAAERLGRPIGSIGPTRGRCLSRLLEALLARRSRDET